MNLYVRNNTFWFELENLTRLFFPNEKINVFREFESVETPYIYTELSDRLLVRVEIGVFCEEKTAPLRNSSESNELGTVKLLYQLLRDFSGVDQPWGLLTGVRPIKLLRHLRAEIGAEKAERRFLEDYFVSPEKLRLASATEERCSRSRVPNRSAFTWGSRSVPRAAPIAPL